MCRIKTKGSGDAAGDATVRRILIRDFWEEDTVVGLSFERELPPTEEGDLDSVLTPDYPADLTKRR